MLFEECLRKSHGFDSSDQAIVDGSSADVVVVVVEPDVAVIAVRTLAMPWVNVLSCLHRANLMKRKLSFKPGCHILFKHALRFIRAYLVCSKRGMLFEIAMLN